LGNGLKRKTVSTSSESPKFDPLMITGYPTAADVGEMPLMLGVAMTVKLAPLLTDPFTVTLTCPLVAPAGSGATI
jgi:hypothetical protein